MPNTGDIFVGHRTEQDFYRWIMFGVFSKENDQVIDI
jgi:hypothetical protein